MEAQHKQAGLQSLEDCVVWYVGPRAPNETSEKKKCDTGTCRQAGQVGIKAQIGRGKGEEGITK